jgi:XTP/dITP diphosphohydrolase
MKKIVIASSNKHKVSEISINIQPFFDTVLSFSDFPEIGELLRTEQPLKKIRL